MTRPEPPGPKTAGFLLELPRMRRGVLAYFAGLSRRYPGPMILIRFGPGASYLPNDPATLREMLVTHPQRMVRRRWWGDLLRLVGEGLLTSDEEAWVPQRRRMRPAYHRDHVGVVEAATRDEAEAVAERWRAAGGVVDAQDEVKRALLRSLFRILFSPDATPDERAIIADLDVMVKHVSLRSQFIRHNLALVGLDGRGEARMLAAAARLDAVIADLIEGTRSGRLRAGLLLAALLPAFERGEIDARNLHDEIGTLLLAGFDTTSAAVTFALWELAERPDLRAAVRAEAGRDTAAPGAMPTTDAVLRETMRLYPPVWAIHRTAGEDIELGGFVVPKGEHIMACPFALHRNPAFWPEPEAFRPDRFLSAPDTGDLPGFAYLPFNHGRHTCIGKRMAMQQARILLPLLAGSFDLTRAGRVTLSPDVILRAKRGVPLRVAAVA